MNRGNFLEFLHYTTKQNEEYRLVALENALGHDKLIAPSIQKDIINAFAVETINKLISDLGDAFFSILVDEARDGSNKELMAIILHYVNKRGCVVECLLSIMHVTDTTALSLKMGIETLFSKYNLSISRLRGQGYDGASNMRGQFNGLEALILKVVAKKDTNIERPLLKVSCVINIVGWSPRHRDLLNEKQALKVKKAIESGGLSTGQGLNQDTSLKRPGETRWGSHYGTLLSLINLFSSVVEGLEDLIENSDNRVEASDLVDYMTSFDFAFNLHMMKNILGITFELSQALQRKDQDIINAMSLALELQLDNYIDDMRSDSAFLELNDITSLAQKIVEKKKHLIYSLVYLLITLALTLPVATAIVERAFSAMKIVKTHLLNRMGDQFLNDSLIPYVEKDLFDSVDKEMVMQRFLNMKPRRGQ
ncbi:uncharacterized protein LOC116144810 [Pistacia vera]|uniref:uncharacterized protein LOC116144810 n=1 Tax=Pistacia vera TaxID=55513 RepID=UPI001263C44D|nr:uncharacterized protein LOC116144810 [Pistacia vera]